MKNTTSKTAAWSPVDLRDYLARTVNAYKEDEHWPHIPTIPTNGLETGDHVPLGTASHPPAPEMIRRAQVVKELLMTASRRHLPGGILGKTTIPVAGGVRSLADREYPHDTCRIGARRTSRCDGFPTLLPAGHSGRRRRRRRQSHRQQKGTRANGRCDAVCPTGIAR
jgi:hypothetical protein